MFHSRNNWSVFAAAAAATLLLFSLAEVVVESFSPIVSTTNNGRASPPSPSINIIGNGDETAFAIDVESSRRRRRSPGSIVLLRAAENEEDTGDSAAEDKKEEEDDDDDGKFVADESAPLLVIKNLKATIADRDDAEILKGVNLQVNKGEVHAIMGTNGSGKSTLSKVIVGYPGYAVSDGSEILYKGSSVVDLEPEDRARIGMFLAFQYPVELPGVSNEDFLRLAYNSKREYAGEPPVDPLEFMMVITAKLKEVDMDPKFLSRNVNEGFSGGEKKRNEILQMVLLDSQLSILDETDSGLDIDALKTVADGVNKFVESDDQKSVVMITHYQRLLDYVKPDFVHVMMDGKIIRTGDATLALELEEKGYDWLLADEEEEETAASAVDVVVE